MTATMRNATTTALTTANTTITATIIVTTATIHASASQRSSTCALRPKRSNTSYDSSLGGRTGVCFAHLTSRCPVHPRVYIFTSPMHPRIQLSMHSTSARLRAHMSMSSHLPSLSLVRPAAAYCTPRKRRRSRPRTQLAPLRPFVWPAVRSVWQTKYS